jgi:hypothetical protein
MTSISSPSLHPPSPPPPPSPPSPHSCVRVLPPLHPTLSSNSTTRSNKNSRLTLSPLRQSSLPCPSLPPPPPIPPLRYLFNASASAPLVQTVPLVQAVICLVIGCFSCCSTGMHPIHNRHLQNLWHTHCTLQNIPFSHGEHKLKRAGTHKTHKRREREFIRCLCTRGFNSRPTTVISEPRQIGDDKGVKKLAGLVVGLMMITTTMMFMIELLLSCFGSRGRMRIKLCKGICKRCASPTRKRARTRTRVSQNLLKSLYANSWSKTSFRRMHNLRDV